MVPVNPVIDTTELAAALASPNPPVVLDIRWKLGGPPGHPAYLEGHVPGAHYADMEADLSAEPGVDGRHPLPDPDAFTAAMRRFGISTDTDVVTYDGAEGVGAARAWWVLRYFGHTRVRVLDGGYRAWQAAGLPVETAEPVTGTGDFTAKPGGMPLLDAVQAAEYGQADDAVLIDVRAVERFRGETEPVDPVAGHIPGAVNAPEPGTLDDDNLFLLAAAALRARYEAVGALPGVRVGAYCGSGATAAHAVLAMELAGIEAALYAPSWSGWITDPSRPVATGE
ncbi:sulfurtransferase [Yinghuangia seranimata]|uniref:sulfurtransferase n=1 Tax=Yinghuangia seranimata TaxID=408067 RepID=UPI00248CA81F|nr:sulfurtransferase [Yinghuangia seranimata]MDI2128697.1 sulfurtransferase [Yinghuangia seranimata]